MEGMALKQKPRVPNSESESSASNGGQRCGRGGCTGRGGHQGHGGQGGRFNRPAHTSSIRNFNGEVDGFGVVLGTMVEKNKPSKSKGISARS